MPEISVIVPVYNCEKYLEKCINSILNQSFKDLEIILINDGSTDKSGEICDKFKLKDSRVKVLHQKNGGVSKARNEGLKIATGSFVGFVDSDDYLSPDMYEFLRNNMKHFDAEISICGITNRFIKKNGGFYETRQSKIDGEFIFSGPEAFNEALKSKLFSVNPVNKLFKKSLFEGMCYPEGKISEDAFLIPLILAKASKAVYASQAKYYYIRRENSITTSGFSPKDWCVTEAYKSHLNLAKKEFPQFLNAAWFRYLWSVSYVFDRMVLSDKKVPEEEYFKAFNFIRKNIFKILKNPYFSLKRKAVTLLLLLNRNLYETLIRKMTSI